MTEAEANQIIHDLARRALARGDRRPAVDQIRRLQPSVDQIRRLRQSWRETGRESSDLDIAEAILALGPDEAVRVYQRAWVMR